MYRKISAILIPSLIAVGIIVYMIYRVWDDLLTALQHIVPIYLVAGVIICLSAWWLRGWRYNRILVGLNYHVGVTFSTACVFVSQTVNLIVPARLGDFVRIFILKHDYQTTYSEGISSLVVERVFDIIAIAILGAASLFFIPDLPGWINVYIFIMIAILAIGFGFFIFLIFVGELTTSNKYVRYILTMLDEIRRASLSLRSLFILGASSIVIWMLDVFVCYSVAAMFEQQIPLAVIILAIVLGNLVKAVPITPGGIGTYELIVSATFAITGVAPAVAFLIAVVDDLIKNLVTLAGGIVSIYYLGDWVIPTIKSAISSKLEGGKKPDT
ncbi:lysylphosphatidylglycerol synthase transmembrane domain-containing protein [Methanoregula sp.]|uniref:lysylphosphatidylglycerol synthase transmembrane domain-containing protein n=1 Tax=Methanoregula sp. TaxID=2052170 RepID=UPI002BA55FDE|nr:lysylphosphatidylglycerol synthase transmembrane domain-containing protein [Methanoregula sp.]HVP96660.1 lysylphosphatidylglycerol synthase transmembrane domain-containing protein [Methanoregula sp.]